MESIQQMKNWARAVRERAQDFPWLTLSHAQALEVLVALTSTTRSWNVWIALDLSPELPQSVESYFAAVARGQRRIQELGVTTPESARSGRSYAAMTFLGIVNGTPDEPFRWPWELLTAAGTPVPTIVGYELSQVEGDLEQFFELRLGSWFFQQHLGPRREYGHYPWDNTARLATSMGFAADDAALIRRTQREAPNHSWRVHSWLEVGVLDPDQTAFLMELQQQADWRERFEYLLRTDDGRI